MLERNPFEVIDEEGVGELMRIAVERGRGVKDDLKMGICGEHGGEPRSVAFCHRIGLDYVSCSPYRVPLARLAAAQAVLTESGVRRRAVRRRLGHARDVLQVGRSPTATVAPTITRVTAPIGRSRPDRHAGRELRPLA